jgi:hypothetical protein
MTAVLTIAMVMLVLAGAGFRHLVLGPRVGVAIRMVTSQLNLARHSAILKRQKVALIMPGPNVTLGKPQDRFACLRMALVSGSGNQYEWQEWIETRDWAFLPTGTAIMEADHDAGIYNETTGAYASIPQDDRYAYVNGVPLSQLGGGTGNQVRAAVFSATGQLLGDTSWITVGDGVFTGQWLIRNPADEATNKSAANQLSIKINSFSGICTVKLPAEYE